MELKITDSAKSVTVPDEIFACSFNEALIHQVVTAQMAGRRAGTKAQKTRAEVRGGGIKPFKQKGTGRARAGTIRSPLWRKGGIVFAAKPRSYKQKVNKKMYRGAICSILSELIRQDRMLVLSSFSVDAPKTKELLKKLRQLNIEGSVLLVTDDLDKNLELSARNLPYMFVQDALATIADPVLLLNTDKVVMTKSALKKIEELLK